MSDVLSQSEIAKSDFVSLLYFFGGIVQLCLLLWRRAIRKGGQNPKGFKRSRAINAKLAQFNQTTALLEWETAKIGKPVNVKWKLEVGFVYKPGERVACDLWVDEITSYRVDVYQYGNTLNEGDIIIVTGEARGTSSSGAVRLTAKSIQISGNSNE